MLRAFISTTTKLNPQYIKSQPKTFFNFTKRFFSAPSNPYQTLGIQRGASQKEIKKRYIQLVKKYHPDKNEDNHELFK